jgi:hypothetical protein
VRIFHNKSITILEINGEIVYKSGVLFNFVDETKIIICSACSAIFEELIISKPKS